MMILVCSIQNVHHMVIYANKVYTLWDSTPDESVSELYKKEALYKCYNISLL